MYVYVAGPYASDPNANVREAIKAAEVIREAGHTPFVPHLMHLWDMISPHPSEYWLHYDLDWLLLCEVMVRLPGASRGADREELFAKAHNIPVMTLDKFIGEHW